MSETSEDDDRVPIAYWWGDHPVPELAKIDEERWPAILRQVPSHIRHRAARTLTMEPAGRAIMVNLELDAAEHRRVEAARERVGFPGPLPRPHASNARLGRDHQVSFRLTPGQYAQIIEAAKTLGLKPAQLARMLTLRGVAQIRTEA